MSPVTVEQLSIKNKPMWCPGCGNYILLKCIKKALVELDVFPEKVLIISGIGQAAKTPHYLKVYGMHSIHGRTLPIATGAKLVNHDLIVFAEGGDGDGYAEGMGHFIHALRRNVNITYLVHNNQIYGLTKGQTSPTTELNVKTVSTPFGSLEKPVNPVALAVAGGASYVAREMAIEQDRLVSRIVEAVKHKGFSFLDIIQYCITYNKVNTPDWFKERAYHLEEEGHDPSDRVKAFERALEWGEKIPFGLIYKEERPTLEEGIPYIAKQPLIKQNIGNIDITGLMESFY